MYTRDELLLKSIDKFFENNKNKLLLIEILSKKYAKRVIEWFVCAYSKNRSNYRHVYIDYKDQLNSYTKRSFDPFNRYTKIKYNTGDKIISTTICQLNFFKWFIKNNYAYYILDPVLYTKIKKDMIEKTNS